MVIPPLSSRTAQVAAGMLFMETEPPRTYNGMDNMRAPNDNVFVNSECANQTQWTRVREYVRACAQAQAWAWAWAWPWGGRGRGRGRGHGRGCAFVLRTESAAEAR